MGVRHLDVVTEDLVVADLQGGDARFLRQLLLIDRQPTAAVALEQTGFIQFLVDAVTEEAAFSKVGGRIVVAFTSNAIAQWSELAIRSVEAIVQVREHRDARGEFHQFRQRGQ